MKETPILFSGEMVRPTYDGSKTQTRRLRGLDEINQIPDDWKLTAQVCDQTGFYILFYNPVIDQIRKIYSPYGFIGDSLWVRETWALASRASDISKIYYKAHERASHTEFHEYVPTEKIGNAQPTWPRWKPAIHMYRWASRIDLRVTNVTVERLQDISEEDAVSEGCKGQILDGIVLPTQQFKDLWTRLNGKGSWEKNPWLWVVSFERIKS